MELFLPNNCVKIPKIIQTLLMEMTSPLVQVYVPVVVVVSVVVVVVLAVVDVPVVVVQSERKDEKTSVPSIYI